MYKYEYPRPAVSVDVFVVRKTENGYETLLIKRKNEPFAGHWALPGGFLDEGETLESAAIRELKEETNIGLSGLRQIKAYSEPQRDPRTRVISIAFLAEATNDAIPVAGDDAADANWFGIDDLPDLAFDHDTIVKDGMKIVVN